MLKALVSSQNKGKADLNIFCYIVLKFMPSHACIKQKTEGICLLVKYVELEFCAHRGENSCTVLISFWSIMQL